MNKSIIIGRMTRDAEVRQNNETKVARFTLAVDRYNSDADFIPCVAFGKNADFAEKYLTKGKKICVEGNIKTGSYTNKDGIKVYTTDVYVEHMEFVESKGAEGFNQINAPIETVDGFSDVPASMEDELPFK